MKHIISFDNQEQLVLFMLQQGHEVPIPMIKSMGVRNPRAVVFRLRTRGYNIRLRSKHDGARSYRMVGAH